MKVKKAWNIKGISSKFVVELEDNTLWFFPVVPIQSVDTKSLTPYKGHHPEKINSHELYIDLYRFYGLEKWFDIAQDAGSIRHPMQYQIKIKGGC